MYILTTLEFPTHNFDFHLLTTSVNAKYYYDLCTYLCAFVSVISTHTPFRSGRVGLTPLTDNVY